MWKKRLVKFLVWTFSVLATLVAVITLLIYVYKDDIINLAIGQANKYLKAKVEVRNVELTFWGSFPNLSIDFNNVFIQDGLEGSTKYDTLLYTDRIRCKFNPMDIWREKYEIKSVEIGKGTLQLKVDSLGLNNYDILKSPDSSATEKPMEFKLERLYLDDLRIAYSNALTAQDYRTRVHQMGATGDFSQRRFTAKTIADFEILEAKTGEIAVVKNQEANLNLGIVVDLDSNSVSIPNSTVYIAELPFNFNGYFDSLSYSFHLDGKNLKLEEVANKLAPDRTRELRKFSGKGDVHFELDITGENDPTMGSDINCSFGVKGGSLNEPDTRIKIKDLIVDGSFTRKGSPGSERLDLKTIRFNSPLGAFSGNLQIENFLRPVYRCNAEGGIDLTVLNQFFFSNVLQDLSGAAQLKTKLILQQDKDRNGHDRFKVVQLSGEADLKKVKVRLIDDKREFKNISGSLLLRNDQIGVRNLHVDLLNSDLTIDGFFSGINDFINGTAPIKTEVEVRSNRIHIADLSSSDKASKLVGSREFVLPNTMTGRITMNINDIDYENHHFTDCEGVIGITGRNIIIDKFHFKNAGSRISGSIAVREERPEILQLTCNLVSNNIAVSALFKEWNNFDQSVITENSIHGNAKINLDLKIPFDFRNGVITNGIEASAALKIQNGRLKDVEAFNEIIQSLNSSTAAKLAIGKENIKSFSSKLRDLNFESLENTITIRNSIITIPTMSVHSSALDVELSGKHHFNNDIDYRFGFRFRDLKQQKESEFGEIIDDGTGKYVFLRMYGNMSNPIVEWDKETNREKRQEKIEQEKQDAKSILKTEFGLFKNDSTVKTYVQEKRQREEIKVSFDVLDGNDSIIESKPKKDTKLNKMLDKWKKEAEDSKKEEFTIEGED